MEETGYELVSVVMATYNGEKYLSEQLDSILDQDYRHLELIIVDDGSIDSTRTILGKYSHRDNRVSYICAEKNAGSIASFERALSLAKGEFIVFSDQDDIFENKKISTMLAALKANPNRDMAVSDLCLIDEKGKPIANSMWNHQQLRVKEGKPFKQLLYMNFVTGCAMMIRRRLLNIALPFPADCIVHDWWLAVICCSNAGGGLILLDQPLTLYRQHGSNSIGSHAVSFQSSINRAAKLEFRMHWYHMNHKRVVGYVSKGFWSADDLSALCLARNAFGGLCSASKDSLPDRMQTVCKILHVAAAESVKHRFGLVLYLLYPMLVDHLRRLAGR